MEAEQFSSTLQSKHGDTATASGDEPGQQSCLSFLPLSASPSPDLGRAVRRAGEGHKENEQEPIRSRTKRQEGSPPDTMCLLGELASAGLENPGRRESKVETFLLERNGNKGPSFYTERAERGSKQSGTQKA